MGGLAEKTFQRTGKRMRPEELSAGRYKKKQPTFNQRSRSDIDAAVISKSRGVRNIPVWKQRTVLHVYKFSFSPLLQEPVAAALAHGFQSESDKAFWLVYDFGGGTFDAAVIQVRDGLIQVVNRYVRTITSGWEAHRLGDCRRLIRSSFALKNMR